MINEKMHQSMTINNFQNDNIPIYALIDKKIIKTKKITKSAEGFIPISD